MTVRCPDCRTRRATFSSMLKHVACTGHKVCVCGGYHHPHRPGSTCCDRHPHADLHRELRAAGMDHETRLDIVAAWAWSTKGVPGQECPF